MSDAEIERNRDEREEFIAALVAGGFTRENGSEQEIPHLGKLPNGDFLTLTHWPEDNEWTVSRFVVVAEAPMSSDWTAEPEWRGADKQDAWRYLDQTIEAAVAAVAAKVRRIVAEESARRTHILTVHTHDGQAIILPFKSADAMCCAAYALLGSHAVKRITGGTSEGMSLNLTRDEFGDPV